MNKQVAVIPSGYRYDDIVQELEYRGYLGTPSPEGTLIPEIIFRDYFKVTPSAKGRNNEKNFGFFVTEVRRRLYARGFYLDGGKYRVKGLTKSDREDKLVLLPSDRLAQVMTDKVKEGITNFREAVTLGVASAPLVQATCPAKVQDRHSKALNRATTYLEAISRKKPLPVGQKQRKKLAPPPAAPEIASSETTTDPATETETETENLS